MSIGHLSLSFANMPVTLSRTAHRASIEGAVKN